MIKSSKSLSALFMLFICLFCSSRYFQRIFFERDLIYSVQNKLKIQSEYQSCEPKLNSLLHYYKRKNSNLLILVIDAFPNPRVFNHLAGHKSNLHDYLRSNSLETVFVSGASQKTYTSLPYLLGKISPKNNCRYPFLRGKLKPNMLINSKFIATNNSLCPAIYNSISKNSFVRYKNKLRIVIDKNYKNFLLNYSIKCSFKNKEIVDNIVKKLNSTNPNNMNDLNIIHEVKYHSDLEGRNRINGLTYYDEEYLKSIKYLIRKLKESSSIDELIVMNDHGPRVISDENLIFEDNEFNSFFDDVFYGVFVSRIAISRNITDNSNQKILKELIPSSKIRYCDNGLGKIVKIKNLSSLKYCN